MFISFKDGNPKAGSPTGEALSLVTVTFTDRRRDDRRACGKCRTHTARFGYPPAFQGPAPRLPLLTIFPKCVPAFTVLSQLSEPFPLQFRGNISDELGLASAWPATSHRRLNAGYTRRSRPVARGSLTLRGTDPLRASSKPLIARHSRATRGIGPPDSRLTLTESGHFPSLRGRCEFYSKKVSITEDTFCHALQTLRNSKRLKLGKLLARAFTI